MIIYNGDIYIFITDELLKTLVPEPAENELGGILSALSNKYLKIRMPDIELPNILSVINDIKDAVLLSGTVIMTADGYDYSVKYTPDNINGLINTAADIICGKSSEIGDEAAGFLEKFVGRTAFESLSGIIAENTGKNLNELISGFISGIRDTEFHGDYEGEDIFCNVKIQGNSCEELITTTVQDNENTRQMTVKIVVSAAEKDDDFKNSCNISSEKTLDIAKLIALAASFLGVSSGND